jgi:hypothetical protein
MSELVYDPARINPSDAAMEGPLIVTAGDADWKKVLFSSDKQTWGTPKPFYRKLDAEFDFDVDVCASANNAKAAVYYDESLNCLAMDWTLGAKYLRTNNDNGYVKGAECGCRCHFRNNMLMSAPRPLKQMVQQSHDLFFGGKCGCIRDCRRKSVTAFMNPPYGDAEQPCAKTCRKKKCVKRGYCTDVYIPGIADFMEKAFTESVHGQTNVCLVPSRVDTAWWNTWVQGRADEVRHIKGRLVFEDEKGNEDAAPFPTSVIVYRPPHGRRHTHVTTMTR